MLCHLSSFLVFLKYSLDKVKTICAEYLRIPLLKRTQILLNLSRGY